MVLVITTSLSLIEIFVNKSDKIPDSQRVNFDIRLRMARGMRDFLNNMVIPAFNLGNRFEARVSVPISVDNVWILLNNARTKKKDEDRPFISLLIYGDLTWYYKEYLPKGSKKTPVV